jgi:ATP-binding cassette subfamily F protein uup
VQVAYYDQQREQLDPERTVFDTIGEGNDTVTVNGRSRHVNAYLSDFLFPLVRARSPVKALSGGERNRLLLARLFTRPANVLVLDEPTNDLDLETLELLEAQLTEWSGTLLLVSHDRVFLDDVVTSTMVFEGDGRIQEYVGGYEDWVRARSAAPLAGGAAGKPPAPDRGVAAGAVPRLPIRTKLTFNERREFERLPKRIQVLEIEQQQLTARVASAEFYKEGAATITSVLARLGELQRELASAYARWDELDART